MNVPSSSWYAVLGDPVAHSKSPDIHRAFAAQTGLPVHYTKIRIPEGQFDLRLHEMMSHGLRGANVTLPYKFDAFNIANIQTPRASLAQAANTLTITNDEIIADNTDGAGLIADIENNAEFSLSGRRLLIVGAGGAVAGVLGTLISRKPASIVVTNRTLSKAIELVTRFRSVDPTVPLIPKALDDTYPGIYDCIINGTSSSLSNEKLPIHEGVFQDCPLVYDMMYGSSLSFLNQAQESGAMIIRDGLGMLVEQAAESFFIWHKVRPETQPVLTLLRESLR